MSIERDDSDNALSCYIHVFIGGGGGLEKLVVLQWSWDGAVSTFGRKLLLIASRVTIPVCDSCQGEAAPSWPQFFAPFQSSRELSPADCPTPGPTEDLLTMNLYFQ